MLIGIAKCTVLRGPLRVSFAETETGSGGLAAWTHLRRHCHHSNNAVFRPNITSAEGQTARSTGMLDLGVKAAADLPAMMAPPGVALQSLNLQPFDVPYWAGTVAIVSRMPGSPRSSSFIATNATSASIHATTTPALLVGITCVRRISLRHREKFHLPSNSFLICGCMPCMQSWPLAHIDLKGNQTDFGHPCFVSTLSCR